MNKYDALIESCRACASGFNTNCDRCMFCGKDYDKNACFEQLHRAAADAIEELSNAGSIYGKAWTLGYGAGRDENMPRWIPVTERLPDEYVSVLCYCSRNDQYGCGEWRKEDNGTFYWAGLYGMIPTHWMPLPSATTEE